MVWLLKMSLINLEKLYLAKGIYMLEIIGTVFGIFVVMRAIDKCIEEDEEQEKLKVLQQEMREELRLLTIELNKDDKE